MIDKIRTIIVDDHQIFLEGISGIIEGDNIKILAQCKNGEEVLEVLKKYTKVDLLITDINMPILDGIALTKKVKNLYPKMKVIVLSMYEEKHIINKAMQAGADAYMSKNLGKKEILKAISKCMKGEKYISKKISNIQRNNIKINDKLVKKLALTEREIEILTQIVAEKTNTEIGEILQISKRTVETHKKNLMLKMGVNSIVGLTKFAIKNKMIPK
ncbi:MAG: response regulator transcription factor [Flavobacteriales bacterium]|nr:response regulator transcription factor [Flavobacteriales bacterium]